MTSDTSTIWDDSSDAQIDADVQRIFGAMREQEMRILARRWGIELHARAGNRKAILAEITQRIKERKLKNAPTDH